MGSGKKGCIIISGVTALQLNLSSYFFHMQDSDSIDHLNLLNNFFMRLTHCPSACIYQHLPDLLA